MKIIDSDKLDKIKGGGVPVGVIVIIASAALVFLAGVLAGITNPSGCNWWKR